MKQIKSKIHSSKELADQVRTWNKMGEKVVFTNGVFDLIHVGHIAYLAEAAELGTKLIVGVNSDASARTLGKGVARPIKDEYNRACILASMQFVDAVVVFNDTTPDKVIKQLSPNVLVKGGDYDPNETSPSSKRYIVGREVVLKNNGEVKVIPFLPGYSTTNLEKKIIEANN